MFFKSDQNNVSDARDAVKKQLLRSLIQQVVEELNDSSSEGIGHDVADMLADPMLQPVMEELKSSVASGIQNQLFNNLAAEAVAELTPSEEDVEQHVERALEDADMTSLREQVKARTMERLTTEIIPALVQEESQEIADFNPSEDDIQEMVEGALSGIDVPALREQVRVQIDQRFTSDIIPSVVKEESEALSASDLSDHSQRIHDAVTSIQADELIGRPRGHTSAAMIERFQQEIKEEVSNVQDTLIHTLVTIPRN